MTNEQINELMNSLSNCRVVAKSANSQLSSSL